MEKDATPTKEIIEENPFERIMAIESFYKGTMMVGVGLFFFLGLLYKTLGDDLYSFILTP